MCVICISKRCKWQPFLITAAAATAKSLQLCPTLCDPIDGSPPGSPVPGILQARTLEWVDISFSNAWKWKVKVKLLTHVRLLATTWTAAYQAPLPMEFSRQEYWSGVPLPSPEDDDKWIQIKDKIRNIDPLENLVKSNTKCTDLSTARNNNLWSAFEMCAERHRKHISPCQGSIILQ